MRPFCEYLADTKWYYIKERQTILTNMMRGRNVCKYSARQGNVIRILDIESTIISIRKCKLKQAFSSNDTNLRRKMVYQSTVRLVMVYMIATLSISQNWNIVWSVQVGQITSSFWGKDGLAEARWSKTM